MEPLRALYLVGVTASELDARIEALALEQTVEVPREALHDPVVEHEVLPTVESVEPAGEDAYRVRLAYPVATTAFDPAQILMVLIGNSSLHSDVVLEDVDFPAQMLDVLRGPRFGSEGLRKITGVQDRPLTCTAIKPMGLSVTALAELCETFARAGIDVIKDDQGLADHGWSPFEERIRACQAAVERVGRETGHHAVYAPNLTGPPRALWRRAAFAQEAGVRAVMASPMLIGLPTFWELVREALEVPVLAHPTFGGVSTIPAPVLMGTLYRAYGADAVIYPNFGGRFGWQESTCRALAERLRAPLHGIAPSLPVPGGGMSVESAEAVVRFYGRDAMLLIGGSLYVADDLLERSRAFVDAVKRSAELSRD